MIPLSGFSKEAVAGKNRRLECFVSRAAAHLIELVKNCPKGPLVI